MSGMRHGTRWGRATVPLVVGFGLVVAMAAATVNNVLGFEASVKIINSSSDTSMNGMSISTQRLQAVDAGFGMAPVQQSDGTWKNVLRAGFANATATGLCVSKTESLPVVGTYTIKLVAPASAGTITASNGVFDITDIVGNSDGTGINLKGSTQIGLATPDITTIFKDGQGLPYAPNPFGASTGDSPLDVWTSGVEAGSAPSPWVVDSKPHTFGGGWTGIDAGAADLSRISARLWQIQLTGNITLPGLKISVTQGASKCADWPSGPPYTNTTKYDGTNLFP